MNKYKVKVGHLFSEVIDVEAETEDDARKVVSEAIQAEHFKPAPHYETTVPPEHWPVITEEQFNEMVAKIEEENSKNKQEENSESEIAK